MHAHVSFRIKAGQALSSRSDLLPAEYLTELSKLQDRVPPFATSEAFAIIEAELGGPMHEFYTNIDDTYALARVSASHNTLELAHVHASPHLYMRVELCAVLSLQAGCGCLARSSVQSRAARRHSCCHQSATAWSRANDRSRPVHFALLLSYAHVSHLSTRAAGDAFRVA